MKQKEILLEETTALLQNADEKTLKMVYAMLSIQKSNEPTDWWDEMETGQRERLEISILQAEQGLTFPNTEAEKILQKWS
jgi:hypothetical protein